jgi:hypothetical protein
MECEGCEHEALLHTSPEDLRRFEEIIIEYHEGYKELKKFLESSGFSVMIKPIKGFSQPTENQGCIVAKRITNKMTWPKVSIIWLRYSISTPPIKSFMK